MIEPMATFEIESIGLRLVDYKNSKPKDASIASAISAGVLMSIVKRERPDQRLCAQMSPSFLEETDIPGADSARFVVWEAGKMLGAFALYNLVWTAKSSEVWAMTATPIPGVKAGGRKDQWKIWSGIMRHILERPLRVSEGKRVYDLEEWIFPDALGHRWGTPGDRNRVDARVLADLAGDHPETKATGAMGERYTLKITRNSDASDSDS